MAPFLGSASKETRTKTYMPAENMEYSFLCVDIKGLVLRELGGSIVIPIFQTRNLRLKE